MRCFEVTDEVKFGFRYERTGAALSLSIGEGRHRVALPLEGSEILEERAKRAALLIAERGWLAPKAAEAFVRQHHRVTNLHFDTRGGIRLAIADEDDHPNDQQVAIVLIRPPSPVKYTDICPEVRRVGPRKRLIYTHHKITEWQVEGIEPLEMREGTTGSHALIEMAAGATLRLRFNRQSRFLHWTGKTLKLRGKAGATEPYLRAVA